MLLIYHTPRLLSEKLISPLLSKTYANYPQTYANYPHRKPTQIIHKPLTNCQKCDILLLDMFAKKELAFLFKKLRLLYNRLKHIRKRTPLYLFLQTVLSGAANCCFYMFSLYIKISFCPHTFCQKYRMNFKKI